MEFYQQCANYETWHPRTLKGYWWKVLYFLLPAYLQKKVQRVQNVATSFVINRYCTENDVLKLGWLSTLERTQLHLLRNIHQAIYSKTFWPEYIALEIYIPGRNLWSSVAPWLTIPLAKGTFQESSADVSSFMEEVKNYWDPKHLYVLNKSN